MHGKWVAGLASHHFFQMETKQKRINNKKINLFTLVDAILIPNDGVAWFAKIYFLVDILAISVHFSIVI